MSIYLKIGSYALVLYISYKIRVYLSNKWLNSCNNNEKQIDKQMVLFFPEKEIHLSDCHLKHYALLINNNKYSSLAQLLSVLKSTKRSLDICMYSLSFEPIIKLCEDLRLNNDVIIRVITDAKNNKQKTFLTVEQTEDNRLKRLKQLFKIGIELKLISLTAEGYMHNKFAIIDNYLLINGSLNWTENAIFQSYNDVVITSQPMLVYSYLNKFNHFWSLPSH